VAKVLDSPGPVFDSCIGHWYHRERRNCFQKMSHLVAWQIRAIKLRNIRCWEVTVINFIVCCCSSNIPRTVVLHQRSEGFGFILRGAKSMYPVVCLFMWGALRLRYAVTRKIFMRTASWCSDVFSVWNSFWPTVLSVEPMVQYVVCRLSVVCRLWRFVLWLNGAS